MTFWEEWIEKLTGKINGLGDKDWPAGTPDSCVLTLASSSRGGYTLRRDWEITRNSLLRDLGRPEIPLSPIQDDPSTWPEDRKLLACARMPLPVAKVLHEMVGRDNGR